MIEHGDKKHMRKENIVWERLEAGWCHWKGVDVELEVRSREVCERRVGLDVSYKLSAPWLAILGGRVSSRSIRVRISLSLSLFLTLELLTPSHSFTSRFRSLFRIFSIVDFIRSFCDRSRRRRIIFCLFFFFLFPPVLERNSTLRVRVLFLIILARLVSSFLFFLINNIFRKYFFFFLSSISIRFALLTLIFIFLFFFVPLASNFARIRFKIEQQTSVDGKILTFSSPFSPSRIFTPLSPRKHSFIKRSQTDVKIKI